MMEVIALKQLAAHVSGPGPYLEHWPKIVIFVVLVVVVAGAVAIWNRSR
jgi:hypothetical protein